jgi:glycosyltransferase involved in cell wall biosynthesis
VTDPRCSVVVPTHERPEALAACLESLAELDYPRDRFETVVVDDGGRTPLEPVVDRFRERLDVKLVRRARAGPAAARNAGAEHAGGDLLLFTDDDCRPREDWLAGLLNAARAAPGAVVQGATRPDPEEEHLLRRPLLQVQAEGFQIERAERFKLGIVERLAARKPAEPTSPS